MSIINIANHTRQEQHEPLQQSDPPASFRRFTLFFTRQRHIPFKSAFSSIIPVRHQVLLCALVSFTLVSANTTAFSLTVICMTRESGPDQNDTINAKRLNYALSNTQQNSLFSAAALGSILSGLAITSLIGRFGLRGVLSAYGFLSSLACLAIPLAASFGFIPLFIARMAQGAAGPAQYVMVGAIARDWAPAASAGAYLILLSSHFQFGRVVSMPLAAAFCASEQWGWPALYALLGSFTFLSFAVFFLLFRDHPKGHPLISESELRKITREKGTSAPVQQHPQMGTAAEGMVALASEENLATTKSHQQPVPYGAILADLVVWLVLLTYWSDEIGFEMLGQFGPTYLNRILGIDIRHTGLLSALPYLLSVFVKVIAGWLDRRLPRRSERCRINLFTALSQLGMAFCFLSLAILPLAPSVPSWLVQVAYSCVNLFCGLDFLGVVKCSQRISQQFSHVLMAWNSIISSITVIFLPLAITLLAPNNMVDEWSRIFTGIGTLQLIMVLLFFLFCNSEPRDWTKPTKRRDIEQLAELNTNNKK